MSLEIKATVGQRGQVVSPKPIRDAFDLRPGMTVQFAIEDDRIVLRADADTLESYLTAIEKRPEPASVDWDDRYADRFA